MKKGLFAYVILLGAMLLTSCINDNGVRITMDMFLKSTTGPMKDIGTAD